MPRYHITLRESDNGLETEARTLDFDMESHDDILNILDRMRDKGVFAPDSLPALAVGLKLFSGAMRQNRELPVFSAFAPHFGEFMKALKRA